MTNVSARIKNMLNLAGKRQVDLVQVLDMSSAQALNNKIRLDRWSADDLISVAEYLGCELCFIMPDGEKVPLRHI